MKEKEELQTNGRSQRKQQVHSRDFLSMRRVSKLRNRLKTQGSRSRKAWGSPINQWCLQAQWVAHSRDLIKIRFHRHRRLCVRWKQCRTSKRKARRDWTTSTRSLSMSGRPTELQPRTRSLLRPDKLSQYRILTKCWTRRSLQPWMAYRVLWRRSITSETCDTSHH